MPTVLVAHRCGTDKYPELTLAAARHSLRIGAAYVEMDIRFTRDKVPVISHDQDARRLFGSKEKICDLAAVDFLKLNYTAAPQYSPHTLAEFLQAGIAPILLHIKEGGEPLRRLLSQLRAANYEDKIIVGVAAAEDGRMVKEFNRNIKTLAFVAAKNDIPKFLPAEFDIIRLWEKWVTREAVNTIRAAGLKVWIMAGLPEEGSVGYTAAGNLEFWQEIGVDGILINEMEQAKALLAGDSRGS